MSYYIKVASHVGSVYKKWVNGRVDYKMFNEYGPFESWRDVEEKLSEFSEGEDIEVIDRGD